MVYGAAGAGKTIFACSSSVFRTFVFDIDKGLLSAYQKLSPERRQMVTVWSVDRRSDFDAGLNYLHNHIKSYDLAVVDTATELQRLFIADMTGSGRMARTDEWGKVLLYFEEISRVFRSLQVHSLMLCHENAEINAISKLPKYYPSFQGQFHVQYAKHLDEIWRIFLNKVEVQDPQTGNIVTRYDRWLQCNLTDFAEAKDRSQSLQMYEPADNDAVFSKIIPGLAIVDSSQATTIGNNEQ